MQNIVGSILATELRGGQSWKAIASDRASQTHEHVIAVFRARIIVSPRNFVADLEDLRISLLVEEVPSHVHLGGESLAMRSTEYEAG